MRLLAIDPGDEQSALLVYDTDTSAPVKWVKLPNSEILGRVGIEGINGTPTMAVEMIASYGMPVGREVFETCVWIGRFIQRYVSASAGRGKWLQVYRREVKLHLCGSNRAKDANVRQSLIDRYGPDNDAAVGKKASPGPLYGLTGDCWSALGVAITAAETRLNGGSGA